MKQQVIAILRNFGIQEHTLTPTAHFTRDLGLDSLDRVDLIMQLEQTFGIRIPDEDYRRVSTLGGTLEYLTTEQQVGGLAY